MNQHVPDLFHRQVQNEIEMAGLGAERFRLLTKSAIEAGRGHTTMTGKYLIRNAIAPLAEGITTYVNDVYSGRPGPKAVAAKLIKDMDPFIVGYITARTVIALSLNRVNIPLTTAAARIADDLQAEARFTQFATAQPGLWSKVYNNLKDQGSTEAHMKVVLTYAMNKFDIPWERWNRVEAILLGTKLAELMCEYTGFAQITQGDARLEDKKVAKVHSAQYIISLTDDTQEWVTQSLKRGEDLYPSYRPMIYPPKDWTTNDSGGYLSNAVKPLALVRSANTYITPRKASQDAHLGCVFSGLNAIQQTPWKVNKDILGVMQSLFDAGSPVAGLPVSDDQPLPPRPADIDTNPDALRQWKWAARDTHTENLKVRRNRLRLGAIIGMAADMADEKAIYFPHNLDFRGRAYPVASHLHPQGDDLAKALIHFAEGKPLGVEGKRWLAIHGANCFGVDKVSFDERVQWVEDHRKEIYLSARHPETKLWWTEADKPWQFLAFCYEWQQLMDNEGCFEQDPAEFISHLPIALDGSCNGLQHFSAMLLDSVGGSAVNLTPSDKPNDIYQRVADEVMRKLDGEFIEEDHKRWAYGWKVFGVDRKITKRPVMVLPYGGTYRSCMKYVEAEIMSRITGGKEHNFGDELLQAIPFLAKLVWDSIGDVVIAARDAMDWLQSVSRVCSKKGYPMVWTAPSGFVVTQEYLTFKDRLIKTKLAGSMIRLTHKEAVDKIDGTKQATAISPNYVHSLDAAAMIMTVDRLAGEGITSFSMIHDSYGVHACHTSRLASTLRQVFVEMYETDPLTHLRDELVAMYPDIAKDIPPLPKKGTLDLDQVMESDFFFA